MHIGGRNQGSYRRQVAVTLDTGYCMARMMVMERKIHSKHQAGGSNPGQESSMALVGLNPARHPSLSPDQEYLNIYTYSRVDMSIISS
jgi:hypothetical protein